MKLEQFVLENENFRKGPYTEQGWRDEYVKFRWSFAEYLKKKGYIVDWKINPYKDKKGE